MENGDIQAQTARQLKAVNAENIVSAVRLSRALHSWLVIAAYLGCFWAVAKVFPDLPLKWIIVAFVVGRYGFMLLEWTVDEFAWRIIGKRVTTRQMVAYYAANQFPLRESTWDDLGNYLTKVGDHRHGYDDLSIATRFAAMRLESRLEAIEEMQGSAGRRMSAAAQSALDRYSPMEDSPNVPNFYVTHVCEEAADANDLASFPHVSKALSAKLERDRPFRSSRELNDYLRHEGFSRIDATEFMNFAAQLHEARSKVYGEIGQISYRDYSARVPRGRMFAG